MIVLVLGIGNILMSDDGIGVRVVQGLAATYRFPKDVTLLDGGTLGLDLLPRLEGVDRLLVVDAVDCNGEPGTLIRLAGEEVPVALATKVSPHQMGLKDLIAVAELQGIRPREIVLVGVKPACIEMEMRLSPAVAASFDLLVQQVLVELENWGITPELL